VVAVASTPRTDSAVEGSRGSECAPSATRKKAICILCDTAGVDTGSVIERYALRGAVGRDVCPVARQALAGAWI
jgi:hypothetical protein